MIRAVIRGTGKGIPSKVLTNDDLSKLVDTNNDWIVQRTGIHERRIVSGGESTSSLCIIAAKDALANAGIDPLDLDLVVVGTVTPDMIFPSTSCLVQEAIGAKNAGAFDLGAACAGFIYSIAVVTGLIESGAIKRAMVIGVDTLSNTIDWTDRSTCVLFGDGAGAAILEATEGTDRGILRSLMLSDGSGAKFIKLEAGGSLYPPSKPELFDAHSKFLYMAGAEVYRFAVNAMGDACLKILGQLGMTPADIDLFVPHQANLRIIESASEKLGLPRDKVFINVNKYGNTSGGSIPIALAEAVEEGRLKPGMVVLTVGFGAGLVWGANVIRW